MLEQTTKSAGYLTININNLMISYLIQFSEFQFLSLLIGQTRSCHFTEAVWPLKCEQKHQKCTSDLCSNTFFSPQWTWHSKTDVIHSSGGQSQSAERFRPSSPFLCKLKRADDVEVWLAATVGAGRINGRGIKSKRHVTFLHACPHKKLFPWR